MQTDQAASTVHGRHTTTTTISSTFKSQLHPDGVLYSSLDSPIFPTRHSFSRIPYSESGLPDSNLVSNHPYQSRSIQAHQEIVNRHSLCLTHLREATMEAETLRRENTNLRAMNHELNKHLSLLIQLGSSSTDDTAPFELLRAFHGLSIEDRGSAAWDDVADGSPTSVIGSGQNIEVERGRFTLPKSISVRSNGYLKTAGQASGRAGGTTRIGTASPPNITKVYVPRGKKEEEPLELEVCNQGMLKTELCNKWQETGACPYGDQCQFAHGVEELRPILRHPRYKTEVCRMVLAGVVCPYGHRCHFRHALSEQERAMGQ